MNFVLIDFINFFFLSMWWILLCIKWDDPLFSIYVDLVYDHSLDWIHVNAHVHFILWIYKRRLMCSNDQYQNLCLVKLCIIWCKVCNHLCDGTFISFSLLMIRKKNNLWTSRIQTHINPSLNSKQIV